MNIRFQNIIIAQILNAQMQELEQIGNDNFIKLGVMVFQVSQYNWQMLRDYQQALKNIINSNNNSMQQQSNQKAIQHDCTIEVQSSQWYKQYNLAIYFPTNGYRQKYPKSKQNFFDSQQAKEIILVIQINSKQKIQNQLSNLIQKGAVKISNPFALKNQITQQDYCSSLQIGVFLQASQTFLKKATEKYKLFQSQVNKKGQNYLQQKQLIQKRLLSSQIRKQDIDQITFVQIVRWLIRPDEAFLGKKRIQQIKAKRVQSKINRNQANQDLFYNQLKRLEKRGRMKLFNNDNKQQKTVQYTQILSLNFLKEKGEQGQLFDIDSSKVLQKLTPIGFNGELKPYQSRALHWMLLREGKEQKDIGIDMSHTPFWWNISGDLDLKQPLYINQSLNFISWNQKVQKQCKGGILADQMGLGKTIMIIALILSHRPDENAKTLIISPLSLIKQWETQLTIFAPFLRVHVVNQQNLTDAKMKDSDVVIVTEGKLRGQLKTSKGYSNLLNCYWYRIVIDEAHIFKNPKSIMVKNVCQLNAQYRWCLTGTPIQNSIHDLFSILKFLRFSPWCFEDWWQKYFGKESLISNYQQFFRVKQILKGIILRRKKQSVDLQGKKLIDLPAVQVKIHFVKMTEQARQIYLLYNYNACSHTKQYEKLERKIKQFRDEQAVKSLRDAKNYKHQLIWSMIMKMRMICAHQFLAGYLTSYVTKQKFAVEYLKFLTKNKIIRRKKQRTFESFLTNSQQMRQFHKSTEKLSRSHQNWDDIIRQICLGAKFECAICKGSHQQLISPCLHVFCKHCIYQQVYIQWKNTMIQKRSRQQNTKRIKMKQFQHNCRVCSQPFKLTQLFFMPRINQFNRQVQQFKQNQKIKALLEYIRNMKYKDKALIFTSFIGMMTLINYSLKKQGINCLTIQGNDSFEERHKRISQFSTNPNVIALIITLKTGSVGLNLQVANKIFFMDPWWNPAVQQQAIGRTHRLGQQREVQAIKFITQQTIQVRVLKKAFSKKQVSDMILDIDDIQNDKRYSITQSQIRYLLQINDDIPEILQKQSQQDQFEYQLQGKQEQLRNDNILNVPQLIKNQIKQQRKQKYIQQQSFLNRIKNEINFIQKQKKQQDLNQNYMENKQHEPMQKYPRITKKQQKKQDQD